MNIYQLFSAFVNATLGICIAISVFKCVFFLFIFFYFKLKAILVHYSGDIIEIVNWKVYLKKK